MLACPECRGRSEVQIRNKKGLLISILALEGTSTALSPKALEDWGGQGMQSSHYESQKPSWRATGQSWQRDCWRKDKRNFLESRTWLAPVLWKGEDLWWQEARCPLPALSASLCTGAHITRLALPLQNRIQMPRFHGYGTEQPSPGWVCLVS